jgi:hypothetical protein
MHAPAPLPPRHRRPFAVVAADILVDGGAELFEMVVEEMVGAGDDHVVDVDVALMRELGGEALHRVGGDDWDTWNRHVRKTLVDTQVKEGCAAGSWDPGKPAKDAWGEPGGRLMVTSLSTLSLEVYYRYLPIFGGEKEKEAKPATPPE